MNFSFNVNEEIFLVNNIESLRQITRNKETGWGRNAIIMYTSLQEQQDYTLLFWKRNLKEELD